MKRKVAVLGASENPNSYSNKAVRLLTQKGFDVIAVGKSSGNIGDISIQTRLEVSQDIDTITLYLSAQNQKNYYEKITQIKPQKVIFNPGAENPELEEILKQNHIDYENACSLVLLNLNQF
ncbi:MAG: CoA-binding protein [Bacteroidia bacterium]|nr:MAG: CoA-binding protein [Bacteroidia bacterium]